MLPMDFVEDQPIKMIIAPTSDSMRINYFILKFIENEEMPETVKDIKFMRITRDHVEFSCRVER